VLFSSLLYPVAADLPTFLREGSYAQYEQRYSTGIVYELFWNITQVNSSTAEIMIRSHGIDRNYSTGALTIVPGGGSMTIDSRNWTILQLSLPNGTQIHSSPPLGEREAFWIPTSVNETTPITNMYDQHSLPTSTGPMHFAGLPSTRSCWLTTNFYGSGNTMRRWYDKETGIVLQIETNITFMISQISALETLNATNISALTNVFQPTDFARPLMLGTLFLVAIAIITQLAVQLHPRTRIRES